MRERTADQYIAIIQHMRRETGDWQWQGESASRGDNGSACICCGGDKPDHKPDCIIPELPDPWV